MQEIKLATLCNDNRGAHIKFALVEPISNRVFHEGTSTVGALEEGNVVLDCGNNC